jgi:hypothetical protein
VQHLAAGCLDLSVVEVRRQEDESVFCGLSVVAPSFGTPLLNGTDLDEIAK